MPIFDIPYAKPHAIDIMEKYCDCLVLNVISTELERVLYSLRNMYALIIAAMAPEIAFMIHIFIG